MLILSELYARNANQAELWKKHRKKQVLFEIKNILLDTIIIDDLDENTPILDQLVYIVDKINELDINVHQKLMERAKRQYNEGPHHPYKLTTKITTI